MSDIPVWREETRVKAYEADFAGRWKPATFFQVMTAAASEHAAQLGYEFERMMNEGMIWVLSRMKIRFIDFPAIRETVIIETWPKG
ncbi:MAG: acyl-ACP thioesterase domain-containing protein, partial [Anaerolineales bacterium]